MRQVHQDGAAEIGESHYKSRFPGYGPDTHLGFSMGCNLFDDLVTRLRRIPETRHNHRRKTVEVTNLLNIGQRPNYRKEPQTTALIAGYGTGYA